MIDDQPDRRAFAQAAEHERCMSEAERERTRQRGLRDGFRDARPPLGQNLRSSDSEQLDRIEAKLDRLLDALEDVDEVREVRVVRDDDDDDDDDDQGVIGRLFG